MDSILFALFDILTLFQGRLNKETDQLEIVHKPAVLGFRYLGCCYTDKQSIVLVVSVLKQ
ncbi:hypothetical protein B0192_22135 [Leptospira interrogans serovar Australis]|nr:hypothetical protein B0192_22135 [Leptospira interrogans serovar Australis]